MLNIHVAMQSRTDCHDAMTEDDLRERNSFGNLEQISSSLFPGFSENSSLKERLFWLILHN